MICLRRQYTLERNAVNSMVVAEPNLRMDEINLSPYRPTSLMKSKVLLSVILGLATTLFAAESQPAANPPALSGAEAVKAITLPPGFKATLFASEPDVKQPIAFAIDDRGRLWVAEGYTYPKRKGAPPKISTNAAAQPTKEQLADIFGSNDRILVFEDTDGDGKHDKRTVFLDKLNLVSGIEVGFGGVWIGAAPYLMFVPVKDWDNPAPAGDPRILLDGWDYARDTHETLNTFHWGPDGWLYGVHGVFCPSNVGKPGTPVAQRQWVDAAVWRYHPTKHQFEVFAEGTSNPWGFDFDENGQLIEEACVIPHLFHMVQGGRYHRQGGAHYAVGPDETARFAAKKEGKTDKTLHPFIYDDIKTIADHAHFRGGQWTDKDRLASDDLGGGHAHAGMLIYQGDSFPAEYRGKLFMNNIHGARINMDIPERKGSGFVGKHGADFLKFNDKWSQVVDLRAGPDGSIYMIDWYDKNQCHLNTIESHDRSNGRIYKVSYGDKKAEKVDLQKLSDEELVKLLASKNAWQARHAQRVLQERAAHYLPAMALHSDRSREDEIRASKLLSTLSSTLGKAFKEETSTAKRLRILWATDVTIGISHMDKVKALFRDRDEFVRAWTIQLICQDHFGADAKKRGQDQSYKDPYSVSLLAELSTLAREDQSPVVRLYLASALQRLPLAQRGEILEALLAHAEDAKDHNLPLMYWYAAEPLAGQDVATAAKLLSKTKIPQVREYITRRMTAK
jgi:putative membrane-bound dehydrogenase-like protein